MTEIGCSDCGRIENVMWHCCTFRCGECATKRYEEYRARVKNEKENGTYRTSLQKYQDWKAAQARQRRDDAQGFCGDDA